MGTPIFPKPIVLGGNSRIVIARPDQVAEEAELAFARRALAARIRQRRYGLLPVSGGDEASGVVVARYALADGASITGTTEGILSASPVYGGSGTNTAGTGGFWRPGKMVRFTTWGRMTTAATPGNATFNMRLDTISGASLGASAAITLSASQTNISWWAEYLVTCRSVGTAGTLFGMGKVEANPSLIASTAQPVMLPASAPTTATIDTTANHQLVFTILYSVTGDTALLHEELWETLN